MNMRKLLLTLLLLPLVALGVAAVRAATLRPPERERVEAIAIAVDEAAVAARLAEALTYPTISREPPALPDSTAFRSFHAFLERTFPATHAALGRELVGGLSLLYRWNGADAGAPAVVLMGHQDVVPVLEGTEDDWEHPAFAGVIADGFVWGRGAIDDKSTLMSILEAVESLVSEGFQPPRTVYLAFGHDEEVGGLRGAHAIAELLASRGEHDLALVLDEGGAVLPGLANIDRPVGLVGVAEKGFLTLSLSVEAAGGHSSNPPAQTAVGVLSAAIARLEADPFPSTLEGSTGLLFERLTPEMDFGGRFFLGNRWLFGPLLTRLLAGAPESAAMLHTTTAATVFHAGEKDNVLPIEARARVNFRIRPGETVETVTERVRQVISDPRVEIQPTESARDPSPVSDHESPAFRMLERTVHEALGGEIIVAPYVVPGGTDAWYYGGRSANVYRFLPVRFQTDDLSRMHGTGERITTADYANAVRFFRRLIQNVERLP